MSLWSIRMRAAAGGAHEFGGRHISGAERLVPEEQVNGVVQALLARGARPETDFLQLTVERVRPEDVWSIPVLPVTSLQASSTAEARALVISLLVRAGVAPTAAETAVRALAEGPGPGGTVMRGAVLMDAATGRRLEPDPFRGIRVTRVDVRPEIHSRWTAALEQAGLGHHRVLEALLLASKVAASGAVAEVCWSDDPAYTTGYVASPGLGYIRIPHLKEAGDPRGGRVYFLRGDADPAAVIEQLQERPALVEGSLRVVSR